ncbi:MAG TPA: TetR/AcrR family transcriptional regulator [Gemmatimonadales bacterium]|nr:TetR/AcrR family transcriptional regulator [Gemmatimonadales bacterium]
MNDAIPEAQLAILDAAEALFATQGFAATTIKAIGQKADLNPALLYYYYSDKSALYHAVIERRLGAFAHGMQGRLSADLAPLDAIERIVRGQVALFLEAPLFPRLVARELADHAAAHATDAVQHHLVGLFQRVSGIIAAGQKDGTIRDDLDPKFAAISLISQVIWFFVAEPVLSQLVNRKGLLSPEGLDRFADHVIRFTRAALVAPPSGTK